MVDRLTFLFWEIVLDRDPFPCTMGRFAPAPLSKSMGRAPTPNLAWWLGSCALLDLSLHLFIIKTF